MTEAEPSVSKPTVGTAEELGIREDLVENYPEHLRTRYTEVDIKCPKCQAVWTPAVANFVNAETHPVVREGVLRKTMHHARCPSCRQYELDVDHIWDYYDPDEGLIVQVRPKWEYKAGGGEECYWDRLESLVLKYQEEDVRVDVVFGFDDFIEKHLGGDEELEASMRRRDKEIELKLNPGSIRPDNEQEYFTEDRA